MGSAPAFSVTPLEFCSRFHSHRILHRPFGICQSRFLPGRHLPQNSAETQVSRFADFYWSGDLLGMLPALQNSGTAKWGSAPSDRILKPHDAEKNGISFAGICNLQISTAAPDFSFSRAQRLWDVICAIWDLGGPAADRRKLTRHRGWCGEAKPGLTSALRRRGMSLEAGNSCRSLASTPAATVTAASRKRLSRQGIDHGS